MPRRIPDYPDAFYTFNKIASWGSEISAFSLLIFLGVLVESFYTNHSLDNKRINTRILVLIILLLAGSIFLWNLRTFLFSIDVSRNEYGIIMFSFIITIVFFSWFISKTGPFSFQVDGSCVILGLNILSLFDVELIISLLLALIVLSSVLFMLSNCGGCLRGVRQGFRHAIDSPRRPSCGCPSLGSCRLLPNRINRNFVNNSQQNTSQSASQNTSHNTSINTASNNTIISPLNERFGIKVGAFFGTIFSGLVVSDMFHWRSTGDSYFAQFTNRNGSSSETTSMIQNHQTTVNQYGATNRCALQEESERSTRSDDSGVV